MTENQRRNLETAEVLQTILDSIGDAVIVVFKDGWVMKMNPSAAKIFGQKLREAPFAEWLSLGEFSLPDKLTPLPAEEGPLVRALRGDSFDNLELFVRNSQVPAGIFVSINGRAMLNSSNEVIGAVAVLRDITEKKKISETQETLIRQHAEALSQLRTLSGLLPICVKCKKIRDDRGYWNQIEQYIAQHSDAEFSHCICPACAVELYPGIFPKD
jgi:transcriptional regulator with PAS, ATPase and Fis domain